LVWVHATMDGPGTTITIMNTIGTIMDSLKAFGLPRARMKRLLLLMAMIVLVPACTHYYVKPGQTSANFDRDKRECQRIAEKEAARKGTRIYDECEKCLLAKGWQRD